MDPDFIAKTAQIASVLEVSGYPKPGNVHRTRDFPDMIFEDFLISGIVIGNTMKRAAELGKHYSSNPREMAKIEIGKLIKEAVVETDKWVENNTNLGIIMLLTPICAAAGMSNDIDEMPYNIDEILRATTPYDAVNLYEAINIADAGGMGVQDEFDVANENAQKELLEKNINMYDVLDLSSQWDRLANEITRTMPITFEMGYPIFKDVKKDHGINKATVQTFLTILSIYPDTLIARKYGLDTAQEVSVDASLIIKEGGALTEKGRDMLVDFDSYLVKKNYNPGTTADLTASSVMIALLDEYKTNF